MKKDQQNSECSKAGGASSSYSVDAKMKLLRDIVARKGQYDDSAFFHMDSAKIGENFTRFRETFPNVDVAFDVFCNSNPIVLRALISGFEASRLDNQTESLSLICHNKEELKRAKKVLVERKISTDLGIVLRSGSPVDLPLVSGHLKFASGFLDEIPNGSVGFSSPGDLAKIEKHFGGKNLKVSVNINASELHDFDHLENAIKNAIQTTREAAEKGFQLVGINLITSEENEEFPSALTLEKSLQGVKIFLEKLKLAENGEKLLKNLKRVDVGRISPDMEDVEKIASLFEEFTLDILTETFLDLRVTANPSRFLVQNSLTLVTNIIGKRVSYRDPSHRDYIINEGAFGAFAFLSETQIPDPIPLNSGGSRVRSLKTESSLLGPSGDENDFVLGKNRKVTNLPDLDEGDWLIFNDMGAFTMFPNPFEGEFDVWTRVDSEVANQWILTKENQSNGEGGNGEPEDAWRGSFEGLATRDASMERPTMNTKDETASIDSELCF